MSIHGIKVYKQKHFFGMGRKQCGKKIKCWFPAFSPFATMFSNGLFFLVVKNRDCVVKSRPINHDLK